MHRHLRCEPATTAVSRHTSPRQVLPRAKSGFAQFDLRVNDLDNPWLHSAYLKLRLGLLSLAKDFTALSGGSGGGSDIFRKDNPENSRSNPQARGGSAVAHSGELFPRTPILRRPLRVIFLKISIRSACQRIEKFSFRQSKEKFRRKPAFQSAGFHLFTASELRASAALSQFSAKR